jgi:iron complex transport system substrate-binding protein
MAALQARVIRLARAAAIVIGAALVLPSPLTAQRQLPAASRIVSLVPATTEMLFAMGAGGQLVGVGSYDRYPPEVFKLPRLGGLLDPNVEQLIALKPDLVIFYETQAELRRQLQRTGIATFGYTLKTLADVTTTLRALADRIGRHADGERTASAIEARLAAVRARVAGHPRPRTLLVFGREAGSLRGINASGGYGFLHDLLELAGGTDVLADLPQPSVSMSTEMVLTRAPDVIVELHYGEELPASRIDAERRTWAALPSVPAVRNGRVHLLVGDEFVVPGPRVTVAAERLAQVLHPEAK